MEDKLKILDNILKHLAINNNFIKIEEIKKNKFNKVLINDINEYIIYLEKHEYINFNSSKDAIKISIPGTVFIKQGGFQKDARRKIYDVNFKWTFWILSLLISFMALGYSFWQSKNSNVIHNHEEILEYQKKIGKQDEVIIKLQKIDSILNLEIDSLKFRMDRIK